MRPMQRRTSSGALRIVASGVPHRGKSVVGSTSLLDKSSFACCKLFTRSSSKSKCLQDEGEVFGAVAAEGDLVDLVSG